MNIKVVGYGAATIGFLYKVTDSQDKDSKINQIDVYDQNPQDKRGGLGGLLYDGKLVVGPYCGTDQYINPQIQKELKDYFLYHKNHISLQELDKQFPNVPYQYKEKIIKMEEPDITMDSTQANCLDDRDKEDYYQMFYECEMELARQEVKHLGTQDLRKVNERILTDLKYSRRDFKINFHWNTKIGIDEINKWREDGDMVVVAVGRYGTNLVKDISQTNPELVASNNKVDLGVRLELSKNTPMVKELDRRFYEWKVRYKTSNNLHVRTFCHNPSGQVVVENMTMGEDKISIVNGHSSNESTTPNTNFAILVTHSFTEPFNDSVAYGKIIAKQANLLAGDDSKVILQTVGDFMKKKRTKHLFRIKPTLPEDKYVLGDLSYVLPAKTYEAIVEFLEQLSLVVPQVMYNDNLIHGIEVKFYGTKMLDGDNIYFIGDCSGHSRSIIAAASMGYKLAEKIL